MKKLYVNLPVEYAGGRESFLELFLQKGIHPEIGLDGVDFECPKTAKKLESLAERLHAHGLSCTVHLPFTRFESGYSDGTALKWASKEMIRALCAAKLFRPERLVGHPYLHLIPEGAGRTAGLKRAAEFWCGVLDSWPAGPPLCLENVFERSPSLHADLVDMMDRADVGVCFDVGHWHCFAGGAELRNMEEWVRRLGARIIHLHLHDNDGTGDQHLGLGCGSIPWALFFSLIDELNLSPSMTLEAHSVKDFDASSVFISEHVGWFI